MRSLASYCWNHNLLFRSIPFCLPSFPRMDSKLPQRAALGSPSPHHHAHLQRTRDDGVFASYCHQTWPALWSLWSLALFLRVQGSDENSIALLCSLWAAFRPYPPSQGAPANWAVLKNCQNVRFNSRCLFYVTTHQRWSLSSFSCVPWCRLPTCKLSKISHVRQKVKRYLFESTFFWDTRYIWAEFMTVCFLWLNTAP